MDKFIAFNAPNFSFNSTHTFKPTFADYDFDTHFVNHMHNEYEIFFCLQGNLDYFVGGSFYRLNKNDLLIIPPTVFHYPKLLSDAPYLRISWAFAKEHLTENLQSEITDLQVYYKIPVDSVIPDLYENAVAAIDRYEKQSVQPVLLPYLNLILTELVYLDKLDRPYVAPQPTDSLLDDILNYIDKNLHSPLRINTIADALSVSSTHLMHFFKKHMRIGVMQYINRKKILLAQQAIESGTPPTLAAIQLGFENYPTFFIQYKKIIGKAPTASKPRGGVKNN